jgi:hypothetical protein
MIPGGRFYVFTQAGPGADLHQTLINPVRANLRRVGKRAFQFLLRGVLTAMLPVANKDISVAMGFQVVEQNINLLLLSGNFTVNETSLFPETPNLLNINRYGKSVCYLLNKIKVSAVVSHSFP